MKFIRADITPEIIAFAKAKDDEMGRLNNSIERGGGNLAGFIGEVLVANALGVTSIDNTFHYDLVYGDIKIDVKTKRTTQPPRLSYECSVANFNTRQLCDWYVFVRVLNDLSTGWILGYLPKDEYYRKARFLKKGQVDGSNNFVVKADCYNVLIGDLLELPKGGPK